MVSMANVPRVLLALLCCLGVPGLSKGESACTANPGEPQPGYRGPFAGQEDVRAAEKSNHPEPLSASGLHC